MIPITWNTFRLFIHVIAATIWVGGQLTLAGLVPGARAIDPDLPRILGRRFNQFAWPAFGVLFVTGLWNIAVVAPNHAGNSAWWLTLFIKLVVVAASGITAFAHLRATKVWGLALFGTLTTLTALAAVWFGLMLHG